MLQTKKDIICLIIIVLAIILAKEIGTFSLASAQDSNQPMAVFLIDHEGNSVPPGSNEHIESSIDMVTSSTNSGYLMYIDATNPTNIIGPIRSEKDSQISFKFSVNDSIETARLMPPPCPGCPSVGEKTDYVFSLASTFNILSNQNAPPGSTVYLISGNDNSFNTLAIQEAIKPIARLYFRNGWAITGIILPGSSESLHNVFETITKESNGYSINLNSEDGYEKFLTKLNSSNSELFLEKLETIQTTNQEKFEHLISVAPGTSEVSILGVKENFKSEITLSDPKGKTIDTSNISVQFDHSKYFDKWHILDPSPGLWRIGRKGVPGKISLWNHTNSKYKLSMISESLMPLKEQFVLIASIDDGGTNVLLDNVEISGKITTPTGLNILIEMNDQGINGDAKANDGYFSSFVPPLDEGGNQIVKFRVYWPDFDHSMETTTELSIEPFPSFDISPQYVSNLKPNERHMIARLYVNLGPQAFPVRINDIDLTISSNSTKELEGNLEIVPTTLLSDGLAYAYEVFFTPKIEGKFNIGATLNINYLGRIFQHVSKPIVIEATTFKTPELQKATDRIQEFPVPVQPVEKTVIYQTDQIPDWAYYAFPAGLLSIIILLLIYRAQLVRPFGFLYDDSYNVVTDFRSVKRSILRSLFFKNIITGTELNINSFENTTFKFTRRNLIISKIPKTYNTIRIGTTQVVKNTIVPEQEWIGAKGKLFFYSKNLLSTTPEYITDSSNVPDLDQTISRI